MIRTALFSLLAASLILIAACKNEQKPAAAVTPAEQQDPELASLNQQLTANPNNDSLLFQRARLYENLEGYDEALKDLAAAIRIDSLRPQYYHLLADVLIKYGRPNDSHRAIEVLQTAARLFPENIPTLLNLSKCQLIVRQHGDAMATLDKVFRRDPQNAPGYLMAGRVAIDMGDTTRAIVALKKSVQFDAENTNAWRFLGLLYAQRNDPQAVQYFDNALRVDSTDWEARLYKAEYYKKRGEFDQAFATYREIVVRNPDYSNAYFDMGMIYLEQDSLQKAYDQFNIAIKTDPLFAMAFYYRGHSSELMGNKEAALSDYRQAHNMLPSYPEPMEALKRLGAK